jgi:hypothetical protein
VAVVFWTEKIATDVKAFGKELLCILNIAGIRMTKDFFE